ncbi:hypothetical protein RQP53_03650 [Paucibacter sp. APW11]|uniref:Uncharacterized protein n=1 Tax=Roseateles aquae TaxID=3077235 RepID=A0ABU3P771_9BURK|nr:hypothetical protein [Paucibacter sp. APW11]
MHHSRRALKPVVGRSSWCRRAHAYLKAWGLRRRISRLENARVELVHWMAMDEASCAAMRIDYKKSPVLMDRMARDKIELANMEARIEQMLDDLQAMEQAL